MGSLQKHPRQTGKLTELLVKNSDTYKWIKKLHRLERPGNPPATVNHTPSNQSSPKQESAVSAAQTQEHSGLLTCLYLPGKVEGKHIHYLLDTGSTDNVLAKVVFDQLPERIKEKLRPPDVRAHMADGSDLIIYGSITLNCRLRTLSSQIQFKVADITDHAIFGMRFFSEQGSTIHIAQGLLESQGQLLTCVDRAGRPLTSKVQALYTTSLPAGQEALITCRTVWQMDSKAGLIEGY